MNERPCTLTRSEIKQAFRKQLDLPLNASEELLESIIQEILDAITQEESLKISSFGTFLIHKKNKRIGRNPKTLKEAVISERRSVSFRPSKILKKKVNTD